MAGADFKKTQLTLKLLLSVFSISRNRNLASA